MIFDPTILSELERVLRLPKIARTYSLNPRDVQDLLELLAARAVIVTETRTVSATLRDPKGNPILACAIEGHADYIVSGDQDLLSLGRFQGIPVLTPTAFAAILETPR